MLAKSSLKLVRITPKKIRLVADLIRGLETEEAINVLKFTNKRSAIIILKLLNSAIANAINNHGMENDRLFVSKILVNEGPTLKRFRPRAKGSADKLFKRTSKIYLEVKNKES